MQSSEDRGLCFFGSETSRRVQSLLGPLKDARFTECAPAAALRSADRRRCGSQTPTSCRSAFPGLRPALPHRAGLRLEGLAAALLLLLFTCSPLMAAVKEPPPDQVQEDGERGLPQFSGSFLTFFFWQNDSDFDRTEPVFNEYGQSAGYVDVTIFPRLVWDLSRHVRFYYFAEIGDSFWSSHNTDPFSEIAEEKPVYLQKQLWAQIILPGEDFGLRAGFQYIHDPTFLFLEKDVGAFQAFYQQGDSAIRFTAMQVPDTVYEGFDFEENNFQNDVFVFALDGTYLASGNTGLRPGLFIKWDREDVNRPKLLFTPSLNLSHDFGRPGKWMLDLAFQAGQWQGAALNNRDLDLIAGAAQVHGSFAISNAEFETNAFFFTPDDSDPNNDVDTSFDYSGLSRSRTLVLTQNWIFDQYNNLDETAASSKAGYFLVDLFTRYPLAKGLEIFNVVGHAIVLKNRYANEGSTVGTEVDVGLFWYPYPKTRLMALGGVVVPGHAGAAFRNEISLTATDPMYYFQGASEIFF